MSLNNILLTSQLTTDLYSDYLVEEQTKLLTLSVPVELFKFLGNNQSNILILISKDDHAFLEEGELNFLSGILAACKLSVADAAIINLKNMLPNLSYHSLLNQFKSKTVLMFNVAAKSIDLPFNFPYFQLQQFDQCTYLSAPSLKEIEKDKNMKTQLWTCLKKIFRL